MCAGIVVSSSMPCATHFLRGIRRNLRDGVLALRVKIDQIMIDDSSALALRVPALSPSRFANTEVFAHFNAMMYCDRSTVRRLRSRKPPPENFECPKWRAVDRLERLSQVVPGVTEEGMGV